MESRDTPPVNYHMPRGFSQQGVYYHTSDSYRRSSEGVGRNGGEDASSNVRSSSSAVTGVRPAPPRTVRIGPPPGLSYAVRNGGGAGRHPLPPVAQGRRPTSGSTAALQWTPMPTLSPSQRREPRLLKQLFPSKFSAVPRGSVSSVATTTSSSGSSSRRSTVTDAPPVANTASAENPVVTSSPRTSERQSAPSPATCTTPLTVTVVDATASASGDSALAWTASPLGERPGAPSPHFTAPLALSSTLGEASRSASPPAALTETEEAAAAKKAYLHQTSVPRLLDELTVSLAEQQPEHPIDHLLHLLRQRRATLSSESAPAQKQSTPTP